MLELQTQIYIVSGALGGAILILLSWNIILSVLLAKLKKSTRAQQMESQPQPIPGIPKTYVQYPPRQENNPAGGTRYQEATASQSPTYEYNPPSRNVLGPQVLPHSPVEPRDGRGRRGFQTQGRPNAVFVDDNRSGNRIQSNNFGY